MSGAPPECEPPADAPARISNKPEPVTPAARVGRDDPVAARIMELLGREAESDEPGARLFVEQAIGLLCTHILRTHSSLGALGPLGRYRRGLALWQVKKVTAYMREHLADDIGLAELSALVGLSRFHFCTAFRLATGHTPHELMTRLRMERARDLLSDPTLRMVDVAIAVGYQTGSSFASAFRRHFGATPTQYRRSL